MRRLALVVPVLAAAAGCAGAPDPFPPPADGMQIKTAPYTLEASSEKYYCYTRTVAEDTAIVKVAVQNGDLVHHLGVFEAIVPEPDGFSECPSQIKQSWLPLYGGGRSTDGLELPAGAAFKFRAGAQILVQLHLVNATPAAVTETTAVNRIAAKDGASLTPAGIFAVGNLTFTLPAGATGYPVVGDCDAPKPLDVFAVFPHMHRLGRSIALEHGGNVLYKVEPWSFGDQPMKTMQLKVQKGDPLRTTCVYDNTDGVPVKYGESTYDEMCFMVLFYTPFDNLGGCID